MPTKTGVQSSPLHAAGFYAHAIVCALLLYYGADENLPNSLGLTAKQEATGKGKGLQPGRS